MDKHYKPRKNYRVKFKLDIKTTKEAFPEMEFTGEPVPFVERTIEERRAAGFTKFLD